MKKQYFALVLDDDQYIESCIYLMRFINNPEMRSNPHITVRFIYEAISGNELLESAKISSLNLISIGMFANVNNTKYTVYIQCESEEIEELEYKSDFPYSRLHITLYEGTDKDYAMELLALLGEIKLGIKLSFNPQKSLKCFTIGEKTSIAFIKNRNLEFCRNVLNIELNSYDLHDNSIKLHLIKLIIDKLNNYILSNNVKVASTVYDNTSSFMTADIYKELSDSLGLASSLIFEPRKKEYLNKNDEFITPPEYARQMAALAYEYSNQNEAIYFGDPSVGTGSLYFAIFRLLKSNGVESRLQSSIGIEINENMAKEALTKFGSRGLKIINNDALLIDYSKIGLRNLIIANPPYLQYKSFKPKYLQAVRQQIARQLNISIKPTSDIYIYHILAADNWLAHNGLAVWLLPSSFLQTEYAISLRRYLTEKVTLLKVIINDETIKQFDNAKISTTIIVFKKISPSLISNVEISINSLTKNNKTIVKPLCEFSKHLDDWRQLFADRAKEDSQITTGIKFKDLFDIKRGLATGANSFFVLNRSKAYDLGIPDCALKPILPKARYIKGDIILSKNDGCPDIEQDLVLIDCDLPEEQIAHQFPGFHKYLQTAKISINGEEPIINRTLIRTRTPWYKQEKRAPAPYLLTYMGRPKNQTEKSLYFLRNHSLALALNTYILLYPKAPLQALLNRDHSLYEELFESMKQTEKSIFMQTRIYSDNLQKLEPNELKNIELKNLPQKIKETYKKLF